MDRSNPLLEAALEYAAKGWAVLSLHGIRDGSCACGKAPCPDKPGKHPLTPHGDKDATKTTRIIWDWFHQRPQDNIGIALEPSGLVDIAPDSPDWLEGFQKLGLPRTAIFESGGGEGHRHHLYRRPANCPARRLCRPGEYDIMSSGYCVAPPSRHVSGKPYQWIIPPSEFPQGLPEVPDWAFARLQQAAEKAPQERQSDIGDGPPVRLPRVGMAFWQGEKVKQKPDGTTDRSETLFAIAGYLARSGATKRTIVEALENRDIALGFKKYSDRRDDGEYQRAADKVLAESSREVHLAASGREIHSAAIRNEVAAESFALPVRTAKEIGAITPEEPPWLVEGLVARGVVTLLSGKPKSAGKTTLIMHMIAAMQRGETFLGNATRGAKVLYLTEERLSTFREALSRTGLINSEDVLVVSWAEVSLGATWPVVVSTAVRIGLDNEVGLLVVDTLAQWAGLKGDSENDSGAALEAMKPLQLAAAGNLAVLVGDHDRKSGGEVGESNRGSGAKVGAADIVLDLRRTSGGDEVSTRRELHGLSRFDCTPGKLVIELREGHYIALGNVSAVAVSDAMDYLREYLPGSAEAAQTIEEVVNKAGGKVGRTTVQQALINMHGAVTRTGKGTKGSAFRYFLTDANPKILSAATPSLYVAERIPVANGGFETEADDVLEVN